MNTDEPIDPSEIEPEQAKQDAHLPIYPPREWFEAAGVESKTGQLAPFGSARRFAAQRLGISTKSSLESAAMIVFLCIVPREEIDKARGFRFVDGKRIDAESAFREKLEEWCDRIGVRFGEDVPVVRELGRIADEIWDREAASDSQPVLPEGKGPELPNA